jgi:hypothetical protein
MLLEVFTRLSVDKYCDDRHTQQDIMEHGQVLRSIQDNITEEELIEYVAGPQSAA